MSRIHEALQRAYLERGRVPALADIQLADPEQVLVDSPPRQVLSEVQPAKAEIELDDITRNEWKPNMVSFPTLLDRGAGVEQFRGLRSHVYQARYEAPLKTILIASGMPSEGKSFVAANLAMSMARNSVHNILLIDGDLRRPTLHTLLGAPNKIGLSDYLGGSASVLEILQRDKRSEDGEKAAAEGIANLTFLSSGKNTDLSSELVANNRMKELIETVSPTFDWIIIDGPPVLAVTDAVELSRSADAILLVARGASTPYEVAQKAKTAFGNARILGFVLNDIKDAPKSGSYHYNYNYYERRDAESGAPAARSKESRK